MLFTRQERYQSPIPQQDFRSRLIGNHVTIHDLDFEIYEKGQQLRIIPHAEQVKDLKTLPVTDIDFLDKGNGTEVVITSKIRKLDYGGPQLILLFCAFLLGAALAFTLIGRERVVTWFLLGACTIILGIFWVRMEMGYFDYVRKIRAFVRERSAMAL